MSDSQLDLHANITHSTQERLLDFVEWLFDTATEDGTSTREDHERLIASYIEEKNL